MINLRFHKTFIKVSLQQKRKFSYSIVITVLEKNILNIKLQKPFDPIMIKLAKYATNQQKLQQQESR